MQKCTLISVGKIKTAHWKEAAESYRKKLRSSLKVEETAVKDADPALAPAERNRQAGRRILDAAYALPSSACLICLDERGKSLTSKELAALLEKCALESRHPCFIIGGAYGLSEDVLKAAHRKISLSSLTFTHELAQVILWEQLYRADSILRGTGYHHD